MHLVKEVTLAVIAVTLAKLVKIIVSTCMLVFLQQKTAVWACSVTMQDVVVFILCKNQPYDELIL